MPYPRVIPHSDGAEVIDEVGDGVSTHRIGQRVWCYGAQSYRPFGTAAECCTGSVMPPSAYSSRKPWYPGRHGHRAVHAGGSVDGRWVLVQGGAGAVGMCAVQLAPGVARV